MENRPALLMQCWCCAGYACAGPCVRTSFIACAAVVVCVRRYEHNTLLSTPSTCIPLHSKVVTSCFGEGRDNLQKRSMDGPRRSTPSYTIPYYHLLPSSSPAPLLLLSCSSPAPLPLLCISSLLYRLTWKWSQVHSRRNTNKPKRRRVWSVSRREPHLRCPSGKARRGGGEGRGGEERRGEKREGEERRGEERRGEERRGEERRGEERRGEERSGVEWSGVEWSGVEWSGVEWSGVEWSGVEWSGVEWSGEGWGEEERGEERRARETIRAREILSFSYYFFFLKIFTARG